MKNLDTDFERAILHLCVVTAVRRISQQLLLMKKEVAVTMLYVLESAPNLTPPRPARWRSMIHHQPGNSTIWDPICIQTRLRCYFVAIVGFRWRACPWWRQEGQWFTLKQEVISLNMVESAPKCTKSTSQTIKALMVVYGEDSEFSLDTVSC